MNKLILKYLCFYMIIAFITTIIFIYQFQTAIIKRERTAASQDKILQVQQKLKANDKNIQQITESLSESNLAKSRAFANIIQKDPSILESVDRINELAKELMVDELHVTDENGILRYGNIPKYFGLDFNDGDQTKPFLEILKDSSVEIVQEPQPNAALGIMFQYIGVARKDKKGIVQVGIRPEILENMLESTKIEKVFNEFDFGIDGYVFAIDKNSKQIIAIKNQSLIGKKYSEAGFDDTIFSSKEGTAVIDGTNIHFYTESYDDMIIGTAMPEKEYFEQRYTQTVSVSISMFIIFLLLLIVISILINRKIVKGVHNIVNGLQRVKEGNLQVKIEEFENKEFEILSNGINSMVSGISQNLQKNKELLNQQKSTFDKNIKLIEDIKNVSFNIDNASKKTFDMAKSIYLGSKNQEDSVVSLNKSMEVITEQLKTNASVSTKVSDDTNLVVSNIIVTKDNMQKLTDSMKHIFESSNKISNIINEVDSIASQTDMLAVNASIEAARAGEQGKGFAVVAVQIGELAKKSAYAAKETAGIISDTIVAVENGQKIVSTAVSEFLDLVNDIENANKNINQISVMTNKQVNDVINVLSGLEQIAGIAKENRISAIESQNTSAELTKQAELLIKLINK